MASIQQPELNERLAAILAISQKMNSQRDLSSLLDLIAREATSLLDCERASIFLQTAASSTTIAVDILVPPERLVWRIVSSA